MFRRREQNDDAARSHRLFQSAQDLEDYSEYDSPDHRFGATITGSMKAQMRAENAGEYPPKGHGYPRKGR
ncbi:hypothetical protein ABT272_32560 [Streptomyces sp900105245]|uniref:Uncharacterized protein n=1 Tax=Streptomyces sp. 900105245 TaxID=3154379 RepID=A0ABV1UGL5_9ACTN